MSVRSITARDNACVNYLNVAQFCSNVISSEAQKTTSTSAGKMYVFLAKAVRFFNLSLGFVVQRRQDKF